MNKYNLYTTDPYFNSLSEKQKQIFLSAIDLFSKNGFASTSTASIAKEAGVSEGLIFKTFKNKDNLLQKILEPIATKLTPPSLDIATNSKGEVSLQSLIENYYSMKIKFINENDKVAKIFIRECMYNPSITETYRNYLPDDFSKKMNECFDSLKEKKLIANWDNKYLFRSLISALINYLLRNYLFNTKLDPERITYTVKATTKALSPN